MGRCRVRTCSESYQVVVSLIEKPVVDDSIAAMAERIALQVAPERKWAIGPFSGDTQVFSRVELCGIHAEQVVREQHWRVSTTTNTAQERVVWLIPA